MNPSASPFFVNLEAIALSVFFPLNPASGFIMLPFCASDQESGHAERGQA
jgi:hypothetical protein